MPPAHELRCPACSVAQARPRRVRLAVGSPFEECPKCRALVRRPAANEWDLLGAGRKLLWITDRIVPFVLAGLAPAAAYWAFVLRHGGGDRYAFLALLCAGPFLGAALPFLSVRHAIRRSRARMTDPMYRARLIEFGRRGG